MEEGGRGVEVKTAGHSETDCLCAAAGCCVFNSRVAGYMGERFHLF